MSDDSVKTITARFATRQAAELAVEHLVQEHGVERADVFVQPVGTANAAGVAPSGGDAPSGGRDEEVRRDGALENEIEVSADVSSAKVEDALKAFKAAGASHIASA